MADQRATDDGSTTSTAPGAPELRWRTSGPPACAVTAIPTRPTRPSTRTGSLTSQPRDWAAPGGGSAGAAHDATGQCGQYLTAAQNEFRAKTLSLPLIPTKHCTRSTSKCMRANGVPNYPYPTGNTTNFNGTGVDPNSPLSRRPTMSVASRWTPPAWWIDGWGPPGDISVMPAGLNPNSAQSLCAYANRDGCNASTPASGSGAASG